MGVQKQFYEDCHLKTFSSVVTGCTQTEQGYWITLKATAFYPEGGGQPCDLGTLNNARVLDVQESEDQILHLCDRPLIVGAEVNGIIDWQRRFDLMQQHSGEHIVSGIIHRLFGLHNTGFHIGAELVTIDFDGILTHDDLARVEQEANRFVWENIPVRVWTPSPEQLPAVSYRSKKALPWPVRIVEIPGADTCACCGIHVASTGEIGLIKLFSCVKFHQGVRIEMACGSRALTILNRAFDQNRQVSQAFSAKIEETGAAARRMNEMLAGEKFRSIGLEKRLFTLIADSFSEKGNVFYQEEGLAPGSVRALADAIGNTCGGIAAVVSGSSFCLVSKTGDTTALGKDITAQLGGRGGGKPGCFQGSIPCSAEDVLAFFRSKNFTF